MAKSNLKVVNENKWEETEVPREEVEATLEVEMTEEDIAAEEAMQAVADKAGKIYGIMSGASDKAKQSALHAKKAADSGVKALVTLFSGINTPMSEERLKRQAHLIAMNIVGDREASSYGPRKSEMLVLLKNRQVAGAVIKEYEDYSKEQQKEDPKFQINLRQKALGALRAMQKDETLTPSKIVAAEKAKRDHVATPAEKADALLQKLTDTAAFSIKIDKTPVVDPRALEAIELLIELAKAGPDEDYIRAAIEKELDAQDEELAEITAITEDDDALSDLGDGDVDDMEIDDDEVETDRPDKAALEEDLDAFNMDDGDDEIDLDELMG